MAAGGGRDDTLHVMLQGESSKELASLVANKGGIITHDLHLIGAVGAELTRKQLDQVLLSPLVERHIDDLSLEPPPGDEKPQACDVGGSLELEYEDREIRWTIFNKRDDPAILERLELKWPGQMGKLSRVSLGTQLLDQRLYQQGDTHSLDIALGGHAPISIAGREPLRLEFDKPPAPGSAPPAQADFSIKAHFVGGCSTKLVPAYENNHEDFYYSGVVGAAELHRHGITGKGVAVAVLDSGLWEHPSLKYDTRGEPRIIARYDAIEDIETGEVFDESGHGTHMTSVLAHSGRVTRRGASAGFYKGIAPDARLVAVKAFNQEGQGKMLDIVRGIQWVVDNRKKHDIKVLNLSFASRPRWNYWLDPVNQAAMRAWAAGITVVAAAGNEGPDPMTIGSPGNLPYVITVGALTDSWTPEDRSDDYIPDFSSRGPTPSAHIKPDIVGPGGHITGLTRPGSTLTQEYPEYLLRTGEFVMSGSSQASALVSGIAALLLQLEPGLSPDDLKCKLTSSAEPAINSDGLLAYSPFEQGHGYVSATRAVTLGETGCGNLELDIALEIADEEHFQGPAIVDENGIPSLPGLDAMISPQPAEKGFSLSRKWGVKDHVERGAPPTGTADKAAAHPFDWHGEYLREKARIEDLARPPAP